MGAADAVLGKNCELLETYAPIDYAQSVCWIYLPKISGAVQVLTWKCQLLWPPFRSAWQVWSMSSSRMALPCRILVLSRWWKQPSVFIDSYPGDAYVDWVGSDSYNWSPVNSTSSYSTPLHAGWATFGEPLRIYRNLRSAVLVRQANMICLALRKPFVVGETDYLWCQQSCHQRQFLQTVRQALKLWNTFEEYHVFDADVSAAEGSLANWWVDYPTVIQIPMPVSNRWRKIHGLYALTVLPIKYAGIFIFTWQAGQLLIV